MAIDQRHPEYERFASMWKRCRDCVAGEDVVKKEGAMYLPKLDGQNEQEYDAYRARALFYNAARRTKQAVVGALFRKEPQIEPPSDYVEKKCRDTMNEVVEVGRCGILVDAPVDGGDPYMVLYTAEQITNWRYEMAGDQRVLRLVVLKETAREVDPKDEFATVQVIRYRVLSLDEGDHYRHRLYREQTSAAPMGASKSELILEVDTYPTERGTPMTEIPFYFVDAESNDPDCVPPPMLDLVNVNMSHYRSSADLEHGRHFTALPTAWVAGFATDQELRIGSGTAWVTENPAARAGFLEFTGAGLGALENALSQKEHLMAVLGARLFESPKQGVEAAETVRLRQSADTATAASIARLVGAAIQAAYQKMLDMGLGGGRAKVEINNDILDTTMDPATLTSLTAVWQAGGMSKDTFLWNLQRGELLKPGDTIEDEKSKIDSDENDIQSKYRELGLNPVGQPQPAPGP